MQLKEILASLLVYDVELKTCYFDDWKSLGCFHCFPYLEMSTSAFTKQKNVEDRQRRYGRRSCNSPCLVIRDTLRLLLLVKVVLVLVLGPPDRLPFCFNIDDDFNVHMTISFVGPPFALNDLHELVKVLLDVPV